MSLEGQAKNFMTRASELQNQLFETENELEQWKNKYYENERKDVVVEELQNRINIMNIELKKYEGLLNEKNSDLEHLQKQVEGSADLRTKITALEDELALLKDQDAKLEDENQRLKLRLADLEERVADDDRLKER